MDKDETDDSGKGWDDSRLISLINSMLVKAVDQKNDAPPTLKSVGLMALVFRMFRNSASSMH